MGMPLASPFVSALNTQDSNESKSVLGITPAALVLLGVVGASLGIALGINQAYKAYKNYQLKKHLQKMKDANHISERNIGKIKISGCFDIKTLPMPFKMDNPDEPKEVHSFHLEEAEIEDAGNLPRYEGLIALDDYLNEIQSALLLLKEYLQFRIKKVDKNESDDVTCGVLSHMMYLVKTYAMHFQGYEWDIAYLDAMGQYINEYASSSKHEEDSQHFDYLSDIYTHISNAMDLLVKHKEDTSLAFSISEIKNTSQAASQMMLRTLAKLILPHEDHTAIDNATIHNISHGIIKKRHVHTAVHVPIFGVAKTHDSEISLPDSIFKEWIKNLACTYLESIKKSAPNGLDDIEKLFHDIELSTTVIQRAPNKNTSTENKKIKSETEEIKKLFSNAPNFLTTKPTVKKANETVAHYESIKDHPDIIERVIIYEKFILLTHKLITMNYLSMYILNSTKLLGDIYMSDPDHFHKMFDRFYILSDQIKLNCQDIINSMNRIDQNLMLDFKKQKLFETIQKNLKTLSDEIDNEKHEINKIRKTKKTSPKQQKIQVVHELTNVIDRIANMFSLNPSTVAAAPENFTDVSLLSVKSTSSDSRSANTSESSSLQPTPEETAIQINPEILLSTLPPETNGSPHTVTHEPPKHEEPKIIEIHPHHHTSTTEELLDSIEVQIITIKAQEKIHQSPEFQAYQELYQSLQEMQQAALKTKELQKSTRAICEKTLEFLKKPANARKEGVQQFYDLIQTEITNAKPLLKKEPPIWKKILEAAWKIVLCLTIVGGVYLLWKHGAIVPVTPNAKLAQVEKASLAMRKVLTPSV